MSRRTLAIATIVVGMSFVGVRGSLAQTFDADSRPASFTLPASFFVSAALPEVAPAAPVVNLQTAAPIAPHAGASPAGPSYGMVSLYAATAAIQALDAQSTYAALGRGGVEGNPMVSGLVANRGAFLGVKAAVAASSILAAQRLARHNKVAAIAALVAMNSAYALVVSHNYQVARDLK
jgi:hypothetical protein